MFDKISKDDFVMAFYPCIYFCAWSQMLFYLTNKNYVNLSTGEKYEAILERSKLREEFYSRLLRFCKVCETRGIRMAFENPWSQTTTGSREEIMLGNQLLIGFSTVTQLTERLSIPE